MEDNVFGERLRELRQERCESIRDVGKKLFVSSESISTYERGKAFPRMDVFIDLAKYYNVTTDYLLGLSDCKKNDADMQAACKATGFSNEIIEMLHYLSGISWAKEMIGDTIRAMMGGVSTQQFEEHLQKGEIKSAE